MNKKFLRLACTAFLVSIQSVMVLLTSQTVNFSKRLATSDPDVSTLVTEIAGSSSIQFSTLLECANYASLRSQSQIRKERCSAFKFENGNCTLARTPPFIDELVDKKKVINGADGYHVLMEKPLSRDAHFDLVAYILINEEEHFNVHKNLPNPPSKDDYDGIIKRFDFNRESPVKTREGHLAGTLLNNSFLSMNMVELKNFTLTTVCLWYNSGDALPTSQEGLYFLQHVDHKMSLLINDVGEFSYRVKFGESDSVVYDPAGVGLLPDIWYYITITHNIGAGEVRFYLNGSEVFSGVKPSVSEFLLAQTLRVGKVNGKYLSGYIASFELYDKILKDDEILDSMEKSTTFRVGM